MIRDATRSDRARTDGVRAVVAGILVIGAILPAEAAAAVPTARDDWTQFQGNAAHTGYVPGRYAPPGVDPLWSYAAPAFEGREGDRAVAIDEGVVYATVLEGDLREGTFHVLSLDADTGATRWQNPFFVISSNGMSAPSIMDDRLYVHRWGLPNACGSRCYSEPALIGLSLEDGSHLFTTEHDGQSFTGSRPTPFGDHVFVQGGQNGGLDAYDAQTGEIEWFTQLPGQDGWVSAADDEHVYVYMSYGGGQSPGPAPGRLYTLRKPGGIEDEILHPESKSRRVRRPDMQSAVLGSENNAFALTRADGSIDGESILVSFDLADQSIRWQQLGRFSGNMAVGNGMVVIPNGDHLSFYNETTGEVLWHWGQQGLFARNVVLTDNLAFASDEHHTYAINLRSRAVDWIAPVGGELALAHNLLVISNSEGINAYRFDFIPEPGTATLAAAAFGLCAATRRRRRIVGLAADAASP